jgi:hypothetical protein
MNDLGRVDGAAVELQPFERGRRAVLAVPLPVAPHLQAVIELFDKQTGGAGFSAEDQRLLQSAAVFGTDLLRQALASRQTHHLLLEAVEAALGASDSVSKTLTTAPAPREQQPPPAQVLDQMRQALTSTGTTPVDPDDSLRLAEAIRVLALSHGRPAVQYCTRLVESLRELLDQVVGS